MQHCPLTANTGVASSDSALGLLRWGETAEYEEGSRKVKNRKGFPC